MQKHCTAGAYVCGIPVFKEIKNTRQHAVWYAALCFFVRFSIIKTMNFVRFSKRYVYFSGNKYLRTGSRAYIRRIPSTPQERISPIPTVATKYQ